MASRARYPDDREVETCRRETRTRELPPGQSVVMVNDSGVVLGRVPAEAARDDRSAEEAMVPGPTTVRAHDPLDPLLEGWPPGTSLRSS